MELFLIKLKHFINGTKEYYCPYCKTKYVFNTINKRRNISCPRCRSIERHRFLYFVYEKYFLDIQDKVKILHTAPERCIYDLIKQNSNIDYLQIDLFPSKYPFCNCLKEDVTNLSFADNTFDFVLSNHVLEHILDSEKFFSELLRVLKPNGKLCLTFPIFNIPKTFEDASIVTEQDRLKYYGQEDHVRKYGRDIIEKLQTKYSAEIITPSNILTDEEIKQNRINPSEMVFIIKKG